MMFNSFIVASDYNFGAQRPNSRRVFLPTNKTFEGICLALAGKFLSKGVVNSFCIWSHSVKKTIKFSFLSSFMNMTTK